jgi:leader peptidase (prepilin peptidase)/N-methyltransferase
MISSSYFIPITAVVSLLIGPASVWVWNRTPVRWLCEYGAQYIPGGHRVIPKPLGAATSLSVLFFVSVLFSFRMAGPSLHAVWRIAFFAFPLVQLSLSDVCYKILPDQWILATAAAGLLLRIPLRERAVGLFVPILLYVVLALAAAGLGREPGIGAGDAKLASAIGFALGLHAMALIFCFAFLAAGCFALILLLTKKAAGTDRIAFGPFAAFFCFGYLLLSTFSM